MDGAGSNKPGTGGGQGHGWLSGNKRGRKNWAGADRGVIKGTSRPKTMSSASEWQVTLRRMASYPV